jgi:hypothetical protein
MPGRIPTECENATACDIDLVRINLPAGSPDSCISPQNTCELQHRRRFLIFFADIHCQVL